MQKIASLLGREVASINVRRISHEPIRVSRFLLQACRFLLGGGTMEVGMFNTMIIIWFLLCKVILKWNNNKIISNNKMFSMELFDL